MIVMGERTSKGLYICMPENISKVKIDEIANDVALFTAEMN